MASRTHQYLLWSLLVLAAIVRLVFFFQFRGDDLAAVPLLDSLTYHTWALDLVAGDWGWNKTYWMGPLYPHLLALVYGAFGPQGHAPQIIQLAMSLLNIWLVHRLVLELYAWNSGDDRADTPLVALIAAALFAFYGAPVFYAGNLLLATLATALYLAVALTTAQALKESSPRSWFVVGLLVGLSGLTRGNMLILLAALPLLIGKFAPQSPRIRLRSVGLLIAGGLLMLAPATIRNLLVADDFVLLTSNGGVNLLIGQQQQYKGVFAPVMEESQAEFDFSMERTLERELGRELKGSEVSRILTGRAWTLFRKDASAMPLHYLRKTYRFWSGYELPQIVSYDFYRTRFSVFRFLPVPYVLLSALGLVGLVFLPPRARWVVGLLVGGYFLSLLPFFPTSRYRQPIAPLLAVSAAAFLVGMLRRRASRKIWLPVALLAVAALLPRWAALEPAKVQWQVYLHEASRASKRGDLPRTLAKGQRAESVRPGLPDTPYHLSLYLDDLGALEESLAAIALAEARAPTDRLIPYRQGRYLEEAGRDAEALAAYRRAVALDADWSYPWLRMGVILNGQRNPGEALRVMEKAYRLAPGNQRIRSNLASLYAQTGRQEKAMEMLRELTRDYPLYINGWFNLAVLNLQAGNPEAARRAVDRAAQLHGLAPEQVTQIRQLDQILEKQGYR